MTNKQKHDSIIFEDATGESTEEREGEEEDTAKLFLDDNTKIFENFPITLSRHGNVRWTVGEIRRTLFKKDSVGLSLK